MRATLPFLGIWVFLFLACTHPLPQEEPPPDPVCGNGVVENGEDCDGARFAATQKTNCRSYGYNSASVGCGDDCRLDLSPCVLAGACGDGVFNEGFEGCDTALEVQPDCPSPRFSGGQVRCQAWCRADTRTCHTCGDGILSPEDGELVDVDYDACTAAGHFGGVRTTTDCLTYSDDFCGDYRLFPLARDLTNPRLIPLDDSDFYLTGNAKGAVDPFCPNPNPVARVVGYDDDDFELVGYHYIDCETNFLALIPADGPLRMLNPDLGPHLVLNAWTTPDNVILFRRDPTSALGTDRRFSLDFLAPTGELILTRGGLNRPNRHAPFVGKKTDGNLGMWRFYFDPMELDYSPYNALTGALTGSADLVLPTPTGRRDVAPAGSFHADALPSGDWLLQADLEPEPVETYLFHVTTVDNYHLEVDSFWHMDPPIRSWLHRAVDEPSRTLTMFWSSFPGDGTSALHRGVWSFEGVLLDTGTWPMPERYRVEALWPREDGGWTIAGRVMLDELAPAGTGPCEPNPGVTTFGHFFSAQVDTDGSVSDVSTFFSPAISQADTESFFADYYFGLYSDYDVRPRFLQTTKGIYVYGIYNRSRHFCTPLEARTFYEGLPVHSFGLYLVRLPVP